MSVWEERAEDAAAARLAAGVVEYGLNIPAEEILSGGRGTASAAFGRQLAMYLCHVGFALSLARVAVAFRRDRSTVAHAVRAIEDKREEPQFELWVSALEMMLQQAPAPISGVAMVRS